MANTSIGEITATLRLRDEMTARLQIATRELQRMGPTAQAATQQAAQAFNQMQPVLRGVSVDLGRVHSLTQDFGGQTVVGRAQEYAGAIERVGGVAKLTAAEQRQVNAVTTEALAKYRALGQQAPANLIALQQATTHASNATSVLSGAVTKTGIAIGAFFGAAAFGLVTSLANAFANMAAQGAQLNRLRESFDRLTASVGQSGAAILQTTRTATKGLVTDLTILQATNKAVLLGLPITADEMGQLGRTAVQLGRAMGLGPNQALNDLVTALGRTSPLILDNLGLSVKLGEANEKYARALGKTADALTDAERKQAFYNAAMEAARAKTEELGDIQLSAADRVSQAWTTITNAVTNGVAAVLNEIDTFIERPFDAIRFHMGDVAAQAELLAESTSGQLGQMARILEQQIPNGTRALAGLVPALGSADAAMRAFNAANRETDKALRASVAAWEAEEKAIAELVEELTGRDVAREVARLATALDRAGGAAALAAPMQQQLAKELAELERRGAKLPPTLQAIVLSERELTNVSFRSSDALGLLGRTATEVGDRVRRMGDQISGAFAAIESAVLVRSRGTTARILESFKHLSVELPKVPTRLRDEWIVALDLVAAGFERLGNIGGQVFNAIARGIGLAIGATSQLLSSLNQIAAGGFKNILAGLSSLAGALAQLTQLAIGFGRALHDALTRSEAEKVASDIRRAFGVNLAENDPLIAEIEALIAGKGRGGSLSRPQAITLNLDRILEQSGGVTSDNFDDFLRRSVELFGLIEQGGEIGQRALQSLDTVLGDLGAHVVEQGGLWDEYFVAVLQRAQAEGLELASVAKILQGEMDKVSKGLEALTGNFLGQLEASGAKPAGSWMEAIIGDPQRAIEAQAEFDRLGRTVFASFNAFIAQGLSAVEAIDLLGPSIEDLIAASDRFGLAGSAAFNELRRWHELVEGNRDLIDSVAGLNSVLEGLANLGGLTADTFADLQAQGVKAFNDLIAAGFSEQQALAQIAPFLENIAILAERYGLVIDDNTQKLIDQGIEQGLIQGKAISTNDVLMVGLQGLAKLFADIFGVAVPDLFAGMVDDADKAAKGVQAAFDKAAKGVQRAFSSITFPDPPAFDGPSRAPGGPGAADATDAPHLASGGIVKSPTLAVIGEAGPEAVIPLPDLASFFGGGGSGEGGTANIYLDGRLIAEIVVPNIPGVVRDYRLAS